MRRLRITRPAGRDIESIFEYGVDHFGERVALDYRDGLNRIFDTLIESPFTGRPRYEIRPGLRSKLYRSHLVFYEVTDTTVRIARVLHGRMHLVRWLVARSGF